MRGKSGQVELPVGKLMAIILVVVVIFIVVAGWSSGIDDLFSKVKEKGSEVVLLFRGGDDVGVGGDCKEWKVEEKKGGSDFLDMLTLDKREDVVLKICRDGTCEISFGEDLYNGSDRFGVMSWGKYLGYYVESEKDWIRVNTSRYFSDIEQTEFDKELYIAYGLAYEDYMIEYTKVFKTSVEELDANELVNRADIFMYVKVGDEEYRWMGDIKDWGETSTERNYKWHKKNEEFWDLTVWPSFEFGIDEIFESVEDGSEFQWRGAFSIDEEFSGWIVESVDKSSVVEGFEVKKAQLEDVYYNRLAGDFRNLLSKYHSEIGGLLLYDEMDMSLAVSPIVFLETSYGKYKIKRKGDVGALLHEQSVGVFVESEDMIAFGFDDEEWENAIMMTRINNYLVGECV